MPQITWASPSVERNRGYSLEELKTLPLEKLLTPGSLEIALKTFSEQLTSERLAQKDSHTSVTMDLEFHRKDDSTYSNEVTLKLLRDKEGTPTGILGIGRDIERKRIDKALQDSENKYRALIETTQTGFVIIDQIGLVLDANQEYVHLTGHHNLSEIIGRSVIEWTADYEKEKNAAAVRECFKKGYIRNLEVDYVDSKGNITPIEINATCMESEGVTQILTLCRDITERKRAEEEIRRVTKFLDSIVENIPNMVFVKDAKYLRFIRFNRAGEELLGYSRNDLLGKNDYDFFPKGQADFFTEKDQDVLREGEIVDIPEEPIQTRNKGERILHTKKVPILGANREPEYLLGISADITDRKQAEEEKRSLEERLHRAEKMEALGTLAGGVAHDLNNVLGIVVGYAELLLMSVDESSPIRPRLVNIMKGGERAAAIVQDLLTLARRGVSGRAGSESEQDHRLIVSSHRSLRNCLPTIPPYRSRPILNRIC